MPEQLSTKVTLLGEFVKLEPFIPEQLKELFPVIADPKVFAGGYGGGSSAFTEKQEEFVSWGAKYLRFEDGIPFAVRIVGGVHDGELVGTTSIGFIDYENEKCEIGWTAYSPKVWGTAVNPEAKLLLLQYIFDSGFGRVGFAADSQNSRSRSAIERLGAVYEGERRRDRKRPDGSWRDSVFYSILKTEWPAVRDGLEARLEHWRDRPVLFRSVREAE